LTGYIFYNPSYYRLNSFKTLTYAFFDEISQVSIAEIILKYSEKKVKNIQLKKSKNKYKQEIKRKEARMK